MLIQSDPLLTFAGALFFGIMFVTIANRLKISAIVLLLLGGIALGSSSYGIGLIQPESLGDGLRVIIQLSVGLILFEGGLTLNPIGYRTLSKEIKRSLTIGVLITWIISGITVHYIFNMSWQFSFLSGSLIIVTGPTVIGPLLKRISVNSRIHNFLHWEGVLIDPIGVFIALLCYEWIIGHNAVELFIMRIISGAGIGIITGLLLTWIVILEWIPDDKINTFILASALAIFTISDLFIEESGLLSVTIAGFVLGYRDTPQIARLKTYKSQLIELLIGLLFILLAGNLDIETYNRNYGLNMLLAVSCVIFIARPLNIFFSTWGKTFNLKEKLFLSWMAPRGIVAASMASLFAINLSDMASSELGIKPDFLEAFTYAIISATVIAQGFSAPWVAKILKVMQPRPTGWLIIGAHMPGQSVARYIIKCGFTATLMDANIQRARSARKSGLLSICDNALTANPDDYPELYDTGNILAITVNEELNELICQNWKTKLHSPNCYLWHRTGTDSENKAGGIQHLSGTPVWSHIPLQDIIARFDSGEEVGMYTGEPQNSIIDNPERILMAMTMNKNQILPGLPEKQNDVISYLAYVPYPIIVGLPMKFDWVIYSQALNLKDVLKELLLNLKNSYPGLNVKSILNDLLAVQQEMSCVIGYRVCLTHAYTDTIEKSCVLFSKLQNSIHCPRSGDTISFVFLVLSPKEAPEEHIRTLSEISHFLMSEENRESLEKAANTDSLVQAFFRKEIKPLSTDTDV